MDPNWAKILDPDPNSTYFDAQHCIKRVFKYKFLIGTSRGRSNHACHYLRDVLDVGIGQPAGTSVRPTRPGQPPSRPLQQAARPQLGGTGQLPTRPGQPAAARHAQQLVGNGQAVQGLLLTRLENKMVALKSDQVSREGLNTVLVKKEITIQHENILFFIFPVFFRYVHLTENQQKKYSLYNIEL